MSTTAPHRTPLLSENSQEVVRATAAVVAENAETITARFYPSMLAAHPELLRVFNTGNQATGEQSRALAASVVAYAVQLIDPDAPPFDHVLRRIAHKHVSLGIRPDQYTVVGRHLLAAVGEVLGDAVTPEVAAAWDEVYWLFATQLIAEEARLYHLAGVDPAAPVRPYRVVRRVRETAEVVSLVLEPADGEPLPAVLPGQYVSVFADLPDGGRQPRQYTVSSSRSGTRLRITVRRVRGRDGAPDGQVSSFLHDHVAVGDLLDVSTPAGDVVLEDTDAPLLLASAGAGTTPVLSIVEHVARTQPHRQVVVAHADRTAADHALREAVLRTGAELDDFTALAWYEQPEPGDTTSRQGFMDLSDVPLPEGVQVFTCGPLPFMRQVRATLLARGVPASAIRYEVFGPDLWGAAPEPAQQARPVPRQEVHRERVAV
ncbi:globin domain-containing protein [Kineococcus arenarius]|uniref:globin domain-containing protein n=1 Tax=unclassified Kineococcus TaxID=2621656 RepID=UPI003D7D60AF